MHFADHANPTEASVGGNQPDIPNKPEHFNSEADAALLQFVILGLFRAIIWLGLYTPPD